VGGLPWYGTVCGIYVCVCVYHGVVYVNGIVSFTNSLTHTLCDTYTHSLTLRLNDKESIEAVLKEKHPEVYEFRQRLYARERHVTFQPGMCVCVCVSASVYVNIYMCV
jgi:hypothetical protein